MLQTPVALIIFNRPDTTEQVFAEIAKAKPAQLFIIADGPRPDHPEDGERCAATRAVTERVDWPCEVHRDYVEVNLGCGLRPASGIDWLFEQVDEAIILEDDCVPRPSFFRFCEELLERYRHDDRVMMIGGRYHPFKMDRWSRRFKHSYTFAYSHTNWGWATWKRAWQHYDMEMRKWPLLRGTPWLVDMFQRLEAANHWVNIFDRAYAAGSKADFWDYQWTFSCFARRGLAILPKTHLVSNLGFGQDATHTRSVKPDRGATLTSDMEFPLVHPPAVERDTEFDRLVSADLVRSQLSWRSGWRNRVHRRIRRTLAMVRKV